MKGGGIMNQMKGVIIVVLLTIAFLIPPAQAEEAVEFTRCLSGTATMFHQSKELPPVYSWAANGITMSDDKRFNNLTVHCEGVAMGVGPKRKGYVLCKNTDLDGDMLIYGGPLTAPGSSDFKFMQGSGKWKGIKGTMPLRRIAGSKPGKGAMPGTFQHCHRATVTFELPPK
jgi:hypothetical protein